METIFDTLKQLPHHWPLTVVNENKQPLGYQWQQNPFSSAQLYEAFNKGFVIIKGKTKDYRVKPLGIGLLCGKNPQEFLFAVDCDGNSAHQYLQQLGKMPKTVAFTSGRLRRCQYLWKLPLAQTIKSFKVTTAPGESLEIRGSRHQSVLPPSPHPITGQYKWVNSPVEVEVAYAPKWLVHWIEQQTTKPPKPKNNRQSFPSNVSHWDTPSTSVSAAVALLDLIPSYYADDYDTWIRVGMALKYISPSLLDAWDKWSQLSPKYKPGECAYKWVTFNGAGISDRTLHYFARSYSIMTTNRCHY